MADPIQIWTPIVQEDTSSIANAIAGAGDSLGRGLAGLAERLEKRKEEQKREQINAKSADTLFKANPELQKALGMDEHAFLGLPRAERIAAVAGGISHLTLQQANAKAMREQEEYARQATSAAALQRAAGTTAQRNLERYYEGDEGYTGLPAFDEAMFQNPGMVNAPNFNEFARTVQGAQLSGRVKEPTSKQIGGRDVIYSPDTGAFQVMPPAMDESTVEPIPQYDANGKLLGHLHPTGKGGFTFRAATEDEPETVLDPATGQPTGFIRIGSRLIDARSAFQKAGMGGGNPATGQPAAAKPKFRFDPKTRSLQPVD